MVDGSTTVTVSVISGSGQNPLSESEMDALLLGRTKVSFIFRNNRRVSCDANYTHFVITYSQDATRKPNDYMKKYTETGFWHVELDEFSLQK